MQDMTAALIFRNNKMLCVHNTKHGTLRIEPPGGKREGIEDIESCMIREFREETGCDIEIKYLFGVYETQTPEGSFKVYMFLSDIINGEPSNIESKKHSEIAWYTYEELEQFKEECVLVPNLITALPRLKEYFR